MYLSLVIVVTAFVFADVVYCDAMADMKKFFSDVEGDFTKITWHHRCNSQAQLTEALNSDVMMIEADIIAGHLVTDPTGDPIPVMGHPPDTTGDISLEQFLHKVLERKAGKGIKLDFKSTAIFKASENVLEEFLNKPEVDFPVWINADILRGPGVPPSRQVVDAGYFLTTCVTKFPTAYISAGWAIDPTAAEHVKYETKHIDEMTTALSDSRVPHGVTFPVHSGIASNSIEVLSNLVKTSVDGTTLTLWAGKGEWVDYDSLQKLIDVVGRDKIFVDMPQDMLDKLNVKESKGSASLQKVGLSSTIFSILCFLGSHLLHK